MSKPSFAELLAKKQAELAAKQSPASAAPPTSTEPEGVAPPVATPWEAQGTVPAKPVNPFLARMAAAKAADPQPTVIKGDYAAAEAKAAENLLRQIDYKVKVAEADLKAESEATEVVSIIPKVLLSTEAIKMSNAVVAAGSVADDITSEDDLALIKDRIERLASVDGFDLKLAMDGLKQLILANPAACSQLLPEDIGEMVHSLRRMTGNKEAAAMAAPARRRAAAAKEPVLDATALEDLMNDLIP